MNVTEIILLTVIPYILYKIVLKGLNNKYDIEIGKFESNILFIIIDIAILMINNAFFK
jgi:hypothetical protein